MFCARSVTSLNPQCPPFFVLCFPFGVQPIFGFHHADRPLPLRRPITAAPPTDHSCSTDRPLSLQRPTALAPATYRFRFVDHRIPCRQPGETLRTARRFPAGDKLLPQRQPRVFPCTATRFFADSHALRHRQPRVFPCASTRFFVYRHALRRRIMAVGLAGRVLFAPFVPHIYPACFVCSPQAILLQYTQFINSHLINNNEEVFKKYSSGSSRVDKLITLCLEFESCFGSRAEGRLQNVRNYEQWVLKTFPVLIILGSDQILLFLDGLSTSYQQQINVVVDRLLTLGRER